MALMKLPDHYFDQTMIDLHLALRFGSKIKSLKTNINLNNYKFVNEIFKGQFNHIYTNLDSQISICDIIYLWGRVDSTWGVNTKLQVEVPSTLVNLAVKNLTGEKKLALAA